LREIVTAAAGPTQEELFAELAAIRARTRQPGPGEPTAVEMIREDRDTR
jgi:hypothetical protein